MTIPVYTTAVDRSHSTSRPLPSLWGDPDASAYNEHTYSSCLRRCNDAHHNADRDGPRLFPNLRPTRLTYDPQDIESPRPYAFRDIRSYTFVCVFPLQRPAPASIAASLLRFALPRRSRTTRPSLRPALRPFPRKIRDFDGSAEAANAYECTEQLA